MKMIWRWRIVVCVVLITYSGCVTTNHMSEVDYEPGTDLAVRAAKAQMTPTDAVALIEKYVVLYIDEMRPKDGTANAISTAFYGPDQKPVVTTNGYSYVGVITTPESGGRINVTMKRINVKFADITRVSTVRYSKGANGVPYSTEIVLHGKDVFSNLRCPVDGEESITHRLLASIELLCPNISSKGDMARTAGQKAGGPSGTALKH